MFRLFLHPRVFLFLTVGLILFSLAPHRTPARAYIEPSLHEQSGSLSLIVSATSSERARQAVEQVGGTVTTDLWLIQAVGATVPATRLSELAAQPDITSLTDNHPVDSANDPTWGDGWMTERRRLLGEYSSDGAQQAPVLALADGGAFTVTENGRWYLVNADGSVRTTQSFDAGKPFRTQPTQGSDGSVYFAGEKRVYALNPDGTLRWQYVGSGKFKPGIARATDNTIYVADENGLVVALAPDTGQPRWSYTVTGDTGPVRAAPRVAPDGTLYLVTEKGHLFALTPTGALRWRFVAPQGQPFKLTPTLTGSGTIYLLGEEKRILAVGADGTLRYQVSTQDKLRTQPALAADGSLYVADVTRVYGLNADGSLRFIFTPPTGQFLSSPALSPDGSQVYVALKEKRLYALDSQTGAERWQATTRADLLNSPAVEPSGAVHLGDADGHYTIFSPAGQVLYQHKVGPKITGMPVFTANGKQAVFPGDNHIYALGRLPDVWQGEPDVQATSNPMVWEFVNPVSIDVGADLLHATKLPNGRAIKGRDVTVAVIDSGVYFDRTVKDLLGDKVQGLFVGQADFVGAGSCTGSGAGITQQTGYCFTNHEHSRDPYGHGSHVAGIIWNNFTDADTGVNVGIAPEAKILSIRTLNEQGLGTYEDVIEGVQYAVENRVLHNIRVLNMSISAPVSAPYFVDPLNRAVMAAWASGIVVVTAAGNSGPGAERVTVPGNSPYVITVGAINNNRTPGYWADDTLPRWSANGPTAEGFVKPDVLAPGSNLVSFMYNDPMNPTNSAWLVRQHPDYSETASLFRMNGTSMATAVTSGVVALMLQAQPALTPDEVKTRLIRSAQPAVGEDGQAQFNIFQQGAGRIWAPLAVLTEGLPSERANSGLNIQNDLAHGWETPEELAQHYQGAIRRAISDDGLAYLYFLQNLDGSLVGMGAARISDGTWLDSEALTTHEHTWNQGQVSRNMGMTWAGGYSWTGTGYSWTGTGYSWTGTGYSWTGTGYSWTGTGYSWTGTGYSWTGTGYSWTGTGYSWTGTGYSWTGTGLAWGATAAEWVVPTAATTASATAWVGTEE